MDTKARASSGKVAADTLRAFSLDNVADRLAVSTKTVRRLMQCGELQAVRVGRQWRVPATALEGLLSSRG